ncbi:MAG TPA: hypothetical protein VJ692_01245 [Nitrospiraceae bacterium]|nr:hypothetical protein [Nitrospiraceae bacterium]
MDSGWTAVAAVGLLTFAVATFLATGVALFLSVWPVYRERRRRSEQATLVRSQLLAHLAVIRDFITPRSHPLDLLQREAYEPLQYLWVQAHLLEAEELQLLSRTQTMLLTLRNKPSLNQRETRMAQDSIDRTCSVLERYAGNFGSEKAMPSLTHVLIAYILARRAPRTGSLSKGIEPLRQL